jgi:hypothetical protein
MPVIEALADGFAIAIGSSVAYGKFHWRIEAWNSLVGGVEPIEER